ncbi:hypothetical protein [Streptomyces sp. NPDC096132]|uniref:hypothetical protein n=1 Tax=Streptomyces sp. NPDC096132 TaxID=3366075 RepID=UPI0038002F7A
MSESFPDLPAPVSLVAVCHTDGCTAAELECLGVYYPYGDTDPPCYMGQCGSCQQPITDLRPAPVPSAPVPPAEETPAPTPVPVEPSPALDGPSA